MAMTLDVDPLDLVDPARYQRDGCPYELWARLRAEAPVAYFEAPGYPPFWAMMRKVRSRRSSYRGLQLPRSRRPSRLRCASRGRCPE
jgi:hypothetical protein